jgi:hypothetical protein
MGSPSRFLVVVRAGDQSLHPQWTRDPATRKWDLVVSYFGSDPDRYRGAGEIRIDDKGQKYHGLAALFARDDFWRRYDYIWLPDDDLAAEESAIDDLFALMAELELSLGQPALAWTSHYSHYVTMHSPSFRVRMSNFVEIMAPCFHRPFLETCIPTFTESLSGWGMDWLWPRMLPNHSRRSAVIDASVVTHTRPVGGPTYDKLRAAGVTPLAEAHALMRRFGIPPDIRVRLPGAIDGEGNLLDAAKAPDAARMRMLLARDRASFDAFRAKWAPEQQPGAMSTRRPVHESSTVKWRQ